jgi:trimeric autotransporter adhesin
VRVAVGCSLRWRRLHGLGRGGRVGNLAAAIGYGKPSAIDAGMSLGRSVSLSADGATLAVAAVGDDSNATGIDGAQANNLAQESGAVYLY